MCAMGHIPKSIHTMAFHLLSSFSSPIIVMEAGVSQATDKGKHDGYALPPPLLGNGMMVSSVHPGVIVK